MFNYFFMKCHSPCFLFSPFLTVVFKYSLLDVLFDMCNKRQTGDMVSGLLRHVFTENIYNNFLSANHNDM